MLITNDHHGCACVVFPEAIFKQHVSKLVGHGERRIDSRMIVRPPLQGVGDHVL